MENTTGSELGACAGSDACGAEENPEKSGGGEENPIVDGVAWACGVTDGGMLGSCPYGGCVAIAAGTCHADAGGGAWYGD
jgi:hypothetical protein